MTRVRQDRQTRPLRLSAELLSQVEDLARQHQRSFNSEVVWALEQYIKQQERAKAMEAKVTDQWAEGMLNAAIDEMDEKGIPATPEKFSEYFQENYDLSWTPEEAKSWLEAQDWYQK